MGDTGSGCLATNKQKCSREGGIASVKQGKTRKLVIRMADTEVPCTGPCQDPCAGLNLGTASTQVTADGGIPKVIGLTPGNPVFTCNTDSVPSVSTAPSQSDRFQGYPTKQPHPMYMTTNGLYGAKPPTVHTVPTTFHAKSQEFSNHLGQCGMYRNHSLNSAMDKSNVPDH